ncbi:TniQ family protein [Streptomyces sp. NBC_00984]|uniref:TniQ family protein n=1 Tax=Streptomyces sp. NBC_00984 TaxID=2903700 RepID=UPI00386DF775|nr:TniQ family protein [Streptomyces sp. NBC_00984]
MAPLAPGVFRVRPLPCEATASYLERLARTYRLALPQFLDGIDITEHGHGSLPINDLRLTPGAARRVAAVARIPLDHLLQALPYLTHHPSPHNPRRAEDEPGASWTALDAEQQPVRACTLCARHQSHGQAGAAWGYRHWHHLVCVRHQQAAPDPRLHAPVRTGAVPELTVAHHAHQRLLRHPRGRNTWMAARAITTRWYDHRQHLTGRWEHRLNRLTAASPHLTHTGNASPVLLARDLVTYPETVTPARTLATLPRPRPRTTRGVHAVITDRLGLDTLTPTTSDPLTAYLTHTHP